MDQNFEWSQTDLTGMEALFGKYQLLFGYFELS